MPDQEPSNRRRLSDRGILRRLSPGNWIQISLLLIGLIGGYFRFDRRMERLEELRNLDQVYNAEKRNELDRRLERLQDKEGVQKQLDGIDKRLDRIEKKIDQIR